jgi:hypothetical protein
MGWPRSNAGIDVSLKSALYTAALLGGLALIYKASDGGGAIAQPKPPDLKPQPESIVQFSKGFACLTEADLDKASGHLYNREMTKLNAMFPLPCIYISHDERYKVLSVTPRTVEFVHEGSTPGERLWAIRDWAVRVDGGVPAK